MSWLKTLLFAFCVPGVTLGFVPRLIVRHDAPAPPPEAVRALAWVPLVLGVVAVGWCFSRFAMARGTPSPMDPPKVLVVEGLYRYVRNPIYLGALAILLGQVLRSGSRDLAGYTILFALACHAFVVGYEEPALTRQFGVAYERYRATVPRWIPARPRTDGEVRPA
jgi:protein-S-isoprenylcysteine O-methyltransferase Ste14